MTGSRNSDPAVSGLMSKIKDLDAQKIEANEKAAALEKKVAIAQQELADAQSAVKQIDAERQKCVALVREVAGVLGVSLPELPSDYKAASTSVSPTPGQSVSPETVKAQIERLVKDAEKGFLLLSEIRDQLGGGVDDKTIKTMLHRLGRHGVLKSHGWNWFYIPPEIRGDGTALAKFALEVGRKIHETKVVKLPR